MNVCEHLEPKKVFEYFEKISSIPHGSGNTDKISDFCVSFAKEHNLKYIQDEAGNVIIFKEASKGYETSEPVIIQGHMDMVCEKENGVELDFEKDGLELYVDGDFLKARGTTLGGDDGIALAYAFAILEDDSLMHPPLEVVITVDEEIGMLGAEKMDLSMLKGKKLLNIDSEEEGIFLTSCAGGLQAVCTLPVMRMQEEGLLYEIKVTGLLGGHSGVEIHKERGNAIVLIGRVLDSISKEIPFSLITLQGGLKDNAIPREAVCTILLPKESSQNQEKSLFEIIDSLNHVLKHEFRSSDKEVEICCRKLGQQKEDVLDAISMTKVVFLLRAMPCGVQHMSMDIEGLVETSLNAGIMKLEKDKFELHFSVRSSVTSRKYEVADRLTFLTEFLGGDAAVSGDYPAWEYKADSPVRSLITDIYRELFQKEPQIQAIHAGLECGIFSGKIKDLDCVSMGPEMYDIHTPKERLSISSTERVWKLILEFLKQSK